MEQLEGLRESSTTRIIYIAPNDANAHTFYNLRYKPIQFQKDVAHLVFFKGNADGATKAISETPHAIIVKGERK